MHVDVIMNRRFAVLPDQAAYRDSAGMMRGFDVGVLPIIRTGKLIGILTDRDIVVRGIATGSDPDQTRVTEFMSRGVITCHAGDSINHAIDTMAEHRVRRLMVLNLEQAIAGILSVDDLAHTLVGEHRLSELMRALPEAGPLPA